jgi:hypothetical protein
MHILLSPVFFLYMSTMLQMSSHQVVVVVVVEVGVGGNGRWPKFNQVM